MLCTYRNGGMPRSSISHSLLHFKGKAENAENSYDARYAPYVDQLPHTHVFVDGSA